MYCMLLQSLTSNADKIIPIIQTGTPAIKPSNETQIKVEHEGK